MRRLQLFEFEDLGWFPSVVREAMTDFLSYMGHRSEKFLAPFAERLGAALRVTGDDVLVDLASGGGGPALTIARLLNGRRQRPLHVTLTDLYPNLPRLELARAEGEGHVDFVAASVDATDVPSELSGFRLMCNAFHHLSPAAAERCLGDAVRKRRGVAIVEFARRSPLTVMQVSLGLGAMLLVTPFIRPHRWSRLILTYLLPIVPMCTLWDGWVSCLRAYEPDELKALVARLPESDYEWEVGRLPVANTLASLTYLIGRPRAAT